ncbi:MAG: bifunctional glycosyltransferase family 2/GtrA family protein, partial [Clostridia bacterium]|nr:bifunctional glycosyltransferase family 2/GtrA family protein [Clostridia bacterium]
MITNVSIVLPSYKPDEKLEMTVHGFHEAGFADIIVIDDGGGADYKDIFDRVAALDYCTVLTHEVNRGKGAALKTAFDWYNKNRDGIGVVTADGDGQHTPEDAKKLAVAMEESGEIILGVRDFSLPDVPERSKKGNRITSGVFKIFVGMEISDTQTGLRGIPSKYLEKMCAVYGDRYEYETNMLLFMKRWELPFREVKIQTVYINENETSHFRPVRDSMRIYSLIIKFLVTGLFVKFLGSSVLSFLLDYGLFEILQLLFRALGLVNVAVGASYAVARVFSSLFNYFLNRKIFESRGSVKKTLIRYYLLAACILAVGSLTTAVLTNVVGAIPGVANALGGMDVNEA